MKMRVLREILNVIRTEQERRDSLLAGEDPDIAHYRWLVTDAPFINELCLTLLVALRHAVERSLVSLAARASNGAEEISLPQYQKKVSKARKEKAWSEKDRVKLESCEGWKSMEILRHLANSYKHSPSMMPDPKLLETLNLDRRVSYAPLPESGDLRKGLALSVNLPADADYCEISDRFLDIACSFLADVQKNTKLSRVKGGRLSLHPQDFLH